MLTHFSIFSGIGGIDLAAEQAGFKTIGQVEKADYPYKILCKHWPDVRKWRDIRDVSGDNEINNCTVLSGGFPCQPFSKAGKQKGKDDDRYLWPEMLRIINELRPNWVIGENVTGIINMALDDVLTDLENKNYTTRTFVIPACGVQAPHQRYRVFIVANNVGQRTQMGTDEETRVGWTTQKINENSSCIESNPDFDKSGLQGRGGYEQLAGEQYFTESPWQTTWVEAATSLCGMDDGISARVDRLKCLGNAVVPQQVYPIFKAIADIENKKLMEDIAFV